MENILPVSPSMSYVQEILLIETWRIPDLQDEIARFQQKAVKLGLTPPCLIVSEHTQLIHPRLVSTGQLDKRAWVQVAEVTIDPGQTHLEGWEVLAHVDYETGTAIVRSIARATVPRWAWERGPECDHCQLVRERKQTWILGHEDERIVQVGSTCLNDYTGNINALTVSEHLATLSEWMDDLGRLDPREEWDSEDLDERRSSGAFWDLPTFLLVTAFVIRNHGYTPRSKAGYGITATADILPDYLIAWIRGQGKLPDGSKMEISDADQQLADHTLAWLKELDPVDGNDYLLNLAAIGQAGMVSKAGFGYAASAISAYQRQEADKQAAARSTSNHIGVLGKRQTFDLAWISTYNAETAWGPLYIYTFSDPDENLVVWKTGTQIDWKLGERFQCKATPDKHSEFKGLLTTEVKRLSR